MQDSTTHEAIMSAGTAVAEDLLVTAATVGDEAVTGQPVNVRPRLDSVDLLRGLVMVIMALGPAIIALALFERFNRQPAPLLHPFIVFGRVPLFYYVLHIPFIHALAIVFAVVKYGPAVSELFKSGQPPTDYGYNLPVVYLIWIGVVLALYPVCRWFANVKRRRRDAWLSYL